MSDTHELIMLGDCIQVMRNLPDACIDAVITDPPYSLSFMGRDWDTHTEHDDAGFGYYLSGLIDGEGHFRVADNDRQCTFALKLRADDRAILEQAARYLGHGRIDSEPARGTSKPQARLIIDTKDGCARLCAVLSKYPLRAKKARDFDLWQQAVAEWHDMPRGNRWHGAADRTRLAALGERLREGRAYTEPAWSGHRYQDWTREWAAECLRLLKPGGHLVSFGGTRTNHRLASGIEDAGFEIRDTLAWLYGSGFPKSLDVSKAIDKAAGATREVVGVDEGMAQRGAAPSSLYAKDDERGWERPNGRYNVFNQTGEITAPATPDAATWQGWGTALKPAHEPITLARKPLTGTVAANVLKHGTGALNIAATRIGAAGSSRGDSSECTCLGRADDRRSRTLSTAPPASSDAPLAGRTSLPPSAAERDPSSIAPLDSPGDCPPSGRSGDAPSHLAEADGRAGEQLPAGAPAPLDHPPGESDSPTSQSMPCPHCTARNVEGRWPANVILSHHPDCTPTGEMRSVKSDGHHPAQRGVGGLSTSGHAGQEGLDERHADGETVEVWECHADCAVRLLDEQSGETKSSGGRGAASQATALAGHIYGSYSGETLGGNAGGLGDKGGASRFYYTAKASKRERGDGNTHPTVKPLALMRWLVRLVAPPGALILDPFLGSGTTALACIAEGVEWVGIEQDAGYAEIATQRIRAAEAEQ